MAGPWSWETFKGVTNSFFGQTASGNARQHVGNHYENNTYNTSNYTTASPEDAAKRKRNEGLLEAARRGDTRRLRILLESGADVDYSSPDWLPGRTALCYAADAGFLEVVELLIAAGADINARDNSQDCPLRSAVRSSHYKITELLLTTAGIEKDPEGSDYSTPLHVAARGNSNGTAELLIEHGCQIDPFSRKRETPLHIAAKRKSLETVKVLVDAGANIRALNADGCTPLTAVLEFAKHEPIQNQVWFEPMVAYLEDMERLQKESVIRAPVQKRKPDATPARPPQRSVGFAPDH